MYDNLRMVPFTLTPDQLAAAVAATPFNIWTGSSAPSLVRVPMLLVFSKPAGDAYTVSADARIQITDDDGDVLWSCSAVGFLDQATAQNRVFRPSLGSGNSENLANYQFNLICTGTLTKGTASPNLNGRLYYDHVQVGF